MSSFSLSPNNIRLEGSCQPRTDSYTGIIKLRTTIISGHYYLTNRSDQNSKIGPYLGPEYGQTVTDPHPRPRREIQESILARGNIVSGGES